MPKSRSGGGGARYTIPRSRVSFGRIVQEPVHGGDGADVLNGRRSSSSTGLLLLTDCEGAGAPEPGQDLWEQRPSGRGGGLFARCCCAIRGAGGGVSVRGHVGRGGGGAAG